MLMQRVEERAIGHAIVEGLVIAILVGMTLRTLWVPPAQFREGIAFAAKQLLEFAVLLLGASVNLPELMKAGPALLVGIVLGWILGSRAARDAYAAELQRREERALRKKNA